MATISLLMMQHPDSSRLPSRPIAEVQPEKQKETPQAVRQAELLALFRLLVREPPRDHNFRTCPICKRYGITEI
jgi:hypothetical protein